MRLLSTARRRPAGDDGFSLVEAIVALGVAMAVFTALAFALVGGAKSGLLAQQNQQAGDVLNKAVEQARALPYNALSMRTSDLDTGDARTPALGTVKVYSPSLNATTGAGLENVVHETNGGLTPHVTTEAQNGGTYRVRRYVTVPLDASGAVYKRLTVIVDWTSGGRARSRTYSTLVAETKRGLPLPDFKFTASSTLTQCRNPASQVVYSFTLKNNGARDAWLLTTNPVSPAWSFFADSNGSSAYEAADDLALPAGPSTGLLEPTTSRRFFAVLQLDSTPAPYTRTVVFRASSVAQPTYFQELTSLTSVQSGPCGAVTPSPSATPSASPTAAPPGPPVQPAASCTSLTGAVTASAPGGTLVRYYPHNPDQPGSTTARSGMPLVRDAGSPPALGSLYNYSTDRHSAAGRYLSGSPSDTATWDYRMPAASVLKGDGEVTVWAMPADGLGTSKPSFTVTLQLIPTSGTPTSLGSVTYAPADAWGCPGGMRPFSVPLVDTHGAGTSVPQNAVLRLSVSVTNSVPVRLGYGTSAHPMTVTLPYKNGLG